jgi:hypothetical protein
MSAGQAVHVGAVEIYGFADDLLLERLTYAEGQWLRLLLGASRLRVVESGQFCAQPQQVIQHG